MPPLRAMMSAMTAVSAASAPTCKLPPRLLVTDFDSSLTASDTIAALLSLAPTSARRDNAVKEAVDAYLADFERVKQLLLGGDVCEALHEMERVEHASLDRVETSGLLRGIRKEQYARAAEQNMRLRPHAAEALEAASASGVEVHVCSANWSKGWVEAGLGAHLLPSVRSVLCNDLHLDDELTTSTGGILRSVVSAADKQRCFARLEGEQMQREPGRAGEATVFIGDALSDVLALCAADVGIVIGDDSLLQAALEIKGASSCALPLAVADGGILRGVYRAGGWHEVAEVLRLSESH
uniref:5'-nucleotidase n=1 Tax=Coccolithus braarudii TaxID=221442 RepID=A0A7S0LPV4_9EUKA|mmetsp:Transcript_51856/g.110828  ORF Transcript_51856/g.110828 Transcript_51856/m.110828 type:complete len:296 (+) Transcript_51856:16-903(+)